jgi:MFS family permease
VSALLLTGTAERPDTTEDLRKTLQSILPIFAYVGVVLMLAQGLIYRRLVRRVGEVHFLRAGVALMAFGLAAAALLLALLPDQVVSWPVLGVALTIMTVAVMGFAFLTPSVQALVSRRSDPTRQGEVLGVNQSAAALARILGPFLGPALFFVPPQYLLPYLIGAVLLLGVLLLSLRVRPEQ